MLNEHFYEYIDQLFSAYMKPHKTGFRIDNIKLSYDVIWPF